MCAYITGRLVLFFFKANIYKNMTRLRRVDQPAEDKEPLIFDQNRKNFLVNVEPIFFNLRLFFFFFFSFEFGDQKKRVGVRN